MERQLHFILGLRLWGEEGRGTKNFLAASLRNTQLPCGKEEKRSREKEGLGSWSRVGEEGKEVLSCSVEATRSLLCIPGGWAGGTEDRRPTP